MGLSGQWCHQKHVMKVWVVNTFPDILAYVEREQQFSLQAYRSLYYYTVTRNTFRGMECGICPIAKSTMTEQFLKILAIKSYIAYFHCACAIWPYFYFRSQIFDI